MSKSVFSKIKTFFGRKKEEGEHEEIEEENKHAFAEHEEETLTESQREEDEVRDKEELSPYEAGSEDKTSTQSSREEAPPLLVEDVEKEEALPSEVKLWQEGEVIEDLYEIKEVIGTGGMGVVYIINHRKWNVPLAVKSPRHEIIQSREGKSRFFREAEAWIDIGKHPDIATAYYVRAIAGIPRIFMEYVDGGSLKTWIEQGKLKDWEDILRIAIEFCNGMAYAHDRGLIHRDINPANVLMTKEGKVKITDFGLIKGAGEFLSSPEVGGVKESWKTMTGVGGVFGTPAYMSPEQWDNPHGVGREGDVYSFGVMLFEMITGKRPFEPSPDIAPQAKVLFYKKMHKEDQPQELKKLREDINPKLEMLVLRCLAKEKENRYQSFEKVKRELEGIYEEVVGTPYHAEVVDAVALKADDLNNKALSFLDLGQEEDAVRCWKDALKINPHHMEATFNLGYWEWKNAIITDDQYLGRIKDLELSAGNNPTYWHSLGLIHLERGDLIESLQAIKKALELGLRDASVLNAMGLAYLGLEDFENAEKTFMEAVALQDSWRSRLYLAEALFKMGDEQAFWKEIGILVDNSKYQNALEILGITDESKAAQYIKTRKIRWNRLIKTLIGHKNPVTSVAFSRDGKYALTGSTDKTARLWDIKTGENIKTLTGHTSFVCAVAFSPDGRYALTGSIDTTAWRWDIRTGENIKKLKEQNGSSMSVAFAHDGRYAWIGSGLWDIRTGENVKTLLPISERFGSSVQEFKFKLGWWDAVSVKFVKGAAFSADGKYVLTGSDKIALLWDIKTGENIQALKLKWQPDDYATADKGLFCNPHDFIVPWDYPTTDMFSIALSPDSRYALMAGGGYKTAQLWDLKLGKNIKTLKGHTAPLFSVAFSPDGKYALTGGGDNTARLWDIKTGENIKTLTLKEQKGRVNSVAFSPDGKYALTGGGDNTARLWDVKTGEKTKISPLKKQNENSLTNGSRDNTDCDFINSSKNHFGFILCKPINVQQSNLEEKRVTELINKANALIKMNLFSEAYNVLRQIQTYQGFERSPEILEFLSVCGEKGKRIKLKDAWQRRALKESESVTSVAFSPNGKYAVTVSSDETARLWDIKTGDNIKTLTVFTRKVWAVSPDGRYALTGGDDKNARLWDIKTGKILLEIFHGGLISVAFSPDGKYTLIASHDIASHDNTVRLWDIKIGKNIKTLTGHTSIVHAVAFSPDGKYALTGSWDKTARLWDIKTGDNIKTLRGHTDHVNAVAFSPDGKYALTGGDKTARLWDIKTGDNIKTLIGHTSIVHAVAFSPDSRYALIGGGGETARLWDIKTGENIKTLIGRHVAGVNAVAFSPDGKYALTGSIDSVRLWDIKTGENIKTFETTGEGQNFGSVALVAFSLDSKYAMLGSKRTAQLWNIKTGEIFKTLTLKEQNGWGDSVAFSPDGKYALTISHTHDNAARLWDITTGENIRTMTAYTRDVCAVSPDGRYALTGNHNEIVRLWNLTTGETQILKDKFSGALNSVAFSLDGKYALHAYDKTARLWDIQTGENIKTLTGHTSYLSAVAFSPDGKYALTGSRDGTIRLWDITTGKNIKTLTGHKDSIHAVAFSPDGKYALTGSRDGTIWLCDIKKGENIKTLTGHTGYLGGVAFSPDGKYALTGGDDKTVRLWDIKKGENIKTLAECEHTVKSVAFSPDGKYALIGSSDKTVRLWDIKKGEKLKALTLQGQNGRVDSVIFSPNGKYSLTVGLTKTFARLWDITTGENIKTLTGQTKDVIALSPDGRYALIKGDRNVRLWDIMTDETMTLIESRYSYITSAAFSPDNKYALIASYDNGHIIRVGHIVRLWDIKTGKNIKTLTGHTDYIRAVAFSPDGRYVLTVSKDGTARLWDIKTGEIIKTLTLTEHTGSVNVVAFSPDGKYALTGSDDRTARLWDIKTGEIIKTLAGHKYPVELVAFSPDSRYVLIGRRDYTKLWELDWELEFEED